MPGKTTILFLCTGNSCRSQMAEGWARHLKADTLEAHSAGVVARGLNHHAVEVMKQAGVDISDQASKTMEQIMELGIEPDIVVTVCQHAHETCPIFPAKARIVHHGFDDPPALAENETDPNKALGHYIRVRDEIRAFVEGLPKNLET